MRHMLSWDYFCRKIELDSALNAIPFSHLQNNISTKKTTLKFLLNSGMEATQLIPIFALYLY